MGSGPTLLFSSFSLAGSATLPFVISTEAKRSGEISVWMLLLGSVFLAERTPDFLVRNAGK
jgi:hypothetical protein